MITGSFCQKNSSPAPLINKNTSSFFLPRVQAKLSVNQPGDEHEQEADAMADKVMRMPDTINGQAFFSPSPNFLQRKCDHCEEEEKKQIQKKEDNIFVQRDPTPNPTPTTTTQPPAAVTPPPATVPPAAVPTLPVTPTPAPTATPAPPEPAHAGSGGDVLSAVMAIPQVAHLVEEQKQRLLHSLSAAWNDSSLAGQFFMIAAALGIASGLAGAIYASRNNPAALDIFATPLSGTVIQIPRLSALPGWTNAIGLEMNFDSPDSNSPQRNIMGGVHVDVGRFLPSSWGFGPVDSFNAIGAPSISRKNEQTETTNPSEAKNSETKTSSTENYLHSLGGRGKNLSGSERKFFESKFGRDFSDVKIHSDSKANESAKEINALAYTQGNNIVFGEGQYQPDSDKGKHLLAHELTHVVQQKGSEIKTIQKADIEHRSLNWGDFQGVAPAKNQFDAETFSNIKDPDLTVIKPKITLKELDETCDSKDTPPQKIKKVEASIGMDSSGIKVESFMSQEKSWVKPLFTSEDAMKKFCKTDSQTLGFTKACTDSFAKAPGEAAAKCKPILDQCKAAVKEKKEVTLGDLTATDEAGCNKIFDKCKSDQVAGSTYQSGGGQTITKSADCSPVFQSECLDTRKTAANNLLSHEQGHFDITDVLAKKLETDLKAIVDSYKEKKVVGCGKEEAQKLATDVVEKEVKPKIADKIKEAQAKVNEVKGYTDANKQKVPGTLETKQGSYDDDTTHGTVDSEQNRWKANIAKGTI